MGDSCSLNINCARVDLPQFDEALKDEAVWYGPDEGMWWDEEDGSNTEVNARICEANYGWYGQLEKLAKAGLTFYGMHGAGGTYGPMAFACYKGEYVEVNTDVDGTPNVAVARDGVDQKEINKVKRFYKIEDKARQYIEDT